jgi:LPXTG-motif cell wall-anchored protein
MASVASPNLPTEAPARAATPTASTPVAAATPATSAEPRHLPKTASAVPLMALVAAGSLLLGVTLTVFRRRRSA